MEQARKIKVNQIPAKTWNWLKMNEAEITVPEMIEMGTFQYMKQGNVEKINENINLFRQIHTGMGEEINFATEHTEEIPQVIKATQKGENIAKLFFSLEQGKQYANEINILVEKDSNLTVIMDFSKGENDKAQDIDCGKDNFSLQLIQTKILAKENASVKFIQIHRSEEGETILNDIGGLCEKGANVHMINIVLGDGNVYAGCQMELSGKGSSFDADIGYLLEKRAHLDMNYVSLHKGKKTRSRIHTSGVLRDNAFKLFRGTIDFKKGASESVGDEKEDVLLLDDTVVNQTIPVILCGEEDVEGNHGATIGKLDEELLFYMESRGMDRDYIYEVMSKSRIEAVCNKIEDEQTRDDIIRYLKGEDFNEE